jgi:chemotaxis protein methyltransferase CheR
MIEIGITDTRNLLAYLNEDRGIDLSDFSIVLLKRRIEGFLEKYSYRSVFLLIESMKNDEDLFEQFVYEMFPGSTEMFRDPSFWKYLQNNILPDIFKNNSAPVFFVPACVSGDELYSFCYLINENFKDTQYKVIAGYFSPLAVEYILSGAILSSKAEVGVENFKAFASKEHDWMIFSGDSSFRKKELLSRVSFIQQNINFSYSIETKVDFILCRNKLLNYSQTAHLRIVSQLYDSLMSGGYLAIGVKELPEGGAASKLFLEVNGSESVYRKK